MKKPARAPRRPAWRATAGAAKRFIDRLRNLERIASGTVRDRGMPVRVTRGHASQPAAPLLVQERLRDDAGRMYWRTVPSHALADLNRRGRLARFFPLLPGFDVAVELACRRTPITPEIRRRYFEIERAYDNGADNDDSAFFAEAIRKLKAARDCRPTDEQLRMAGMSAGTLRTPYTATNLVLQCVRSGTHPRDLACPVLLYASGESALRELSAVRSRAVIENSEIAIVTFAGMREHAAAGQLLEHFR